MPKVNVKIKTHATLLIIDNKSGEMLVFDIAFHTESLLHRAHKLLYKLE